MKRLVLCCDGTWNHSVNTEVSNIEKLARSVRVGVQDDGVVQVVGYVGGVGARGYLVDRLLGGAFGYGFTRNVIEGYRFLAMNYEPGDQIVVLGYSRGAYTARSVVGMVAQVGLLKPSSIDAGMLCKAETTYRLRQPSAKALARAQEVVVDPNAGTRARRKAARLVAHAREVRSEKLRFRTMYSHKDVRIALLGVFDTVGALGVPGPSRRRSRFHDVSLASIVDRARQALAIDERRLTFAPCLWQVPDGDQPGRVEQVWFPGTHGDVGGGGARCGLSDLALHWMADEMVEVGVGLDTGRLPRRAGDKPELLLEQAPPWPFRVINMVKRLRPRYAVIDGRRTFRQGLRLLAEPGANVGLWRDGVLLAGSAVRYVADAGYDRAAPNLGWWLEAAGGIEAVPVEPVRAAADDRRPLVLGTVPRR
jgi:uncharacterized protein (DUF2235 family)